MKFDCQVMWLLRDIVIADYNADSGKNPSCDTASNLEINMLTHKGSSGRQAQALCLPAIHAVKLITSYEQKEERGSRKLYLLKKILFFQVWIF